MQQQGESIIQRIQRRQASSVSEQVAAMDQQMVEANKPDASTQAVQQREAHSKAIRSIPDQEVASVAAGPEEQKQHTKIEQQLVEAVHGKGMTQPMLEAVFKAQDPVQGVGSIAGSLVLKLKQANPGATDDVLGSIGERAVEEIVELVEIANPSIQFDEDDMAEAYSIGLQQYMQSAAGEVDENELRSFLANG